MAVIPLPDWGREASTDGSLARSVAPETVPVYRIYNPFDHVHLYTSDAGERDRLTAAGWEADFGGEPCWYAPVAGSEGATEVVRLYNPNSRDHYFVRADDANQIAFLTKAGWQRDGASSSIWSAAGMEGPVEVFTLFNPHSQVDTHLWTTQSSEVNALKAAGWEVHATSIWGLPKK